MALTYESLLREFCDLVGLADAKRLLDGGRFDHHRLDFSLRHDAAHELILVRCHLGAPDTSRAAKVYCALLARNVYLSAAQDRLFSIDPEVGEVVLIERVPAQSIAPGCLEVRLAALAATAQQWKRFVQEGAAAKASPIAPGVFANPAGRPTPAIQ